MKEIFNLEKKYIINTYTRYPVVLEKGKGCWVYDIQGKKYLDFLAGIAVNNLGYSHPEIIKTINQASKNLIHTSNLFYLKPQIELAEYVSRITNKGKVFFANSGAEANEAAIKLARVYGNQFSPPRRNIITLKNSFHGRTIATMSATGQKKYQKGFEPIIPYFKYITPNNIKEAEKAINEKTSAVIIEFIQGEGGVFPLDREYVKNLYKLCKERKVLFIADEIQTGCGRTGYPFAFYIYKVVPDIITIAKGIASGLPMGIMVARNEYAKLLKPGMHASTFGGGYLISSVALKTLKIITSKEFLSHIRKVSKYFINRLNYLKEKYKFISQVRGTGLMLGLVLKIECKEIVQKCLERGLILNCVQNNVLRFLPPLIVTEKEIDTGINILDKVFAEIK